MKNKENKMPKTPEQIEAEKVTSDKAIEDLMNFQEGKPAEPAPTPEPVVAPAAEPAAESKPIEEPPTAALPVPTPTPSPVTPIAAAEPAKTREQVLEEELAAMRTSLNDWARGGPAVPTEPTAVQQASATPTPVAPVPEPLSIESLLSPEALKIFNEEMAKEQAFLTPEEIDSIADKPILIQQALNKASRSTAKNVISIVPHIVGPIVQQMIATQRAADDFFVTNKDLAPYREFTGLVYRKVMNENKTKTVPELLEMTRKEARKGLRLSDPDVALVATQPGSAPGATRPAFASVNKGPGGRTPQVTPGGPKTQQDMMSDLLIPD